MPFIADQGRRILVSLSALAAGALLSAGSAQATPILSALTTCPAQTMVQPFTPWGDSGSYTLPAGGGFEPGTMPWITAGPAAIASGNEPYDVSGNRADAHSLNLPAGSSAISPPVCVTLIYPWMRFFAQNTGSAGGSLQVEVEYVGLLGGVHWLQIASLTGSGAWNLTGQIPLLVNTLSVLSLSGQTPVAFRFTPVGTGSSWRIDDVYIDPYRRG